MNMMDDLIAFIMARLDEDERYLKSNKRHLWTERPLREVEAKRAILQRCAARMNEPDQYPNGLVSPRAVLARQNLSDLATVWSDHSDYRAEWESLAGKGDPRMRGGDGG